MRLREEEKHTKPYEYYGITKEEGSYWFRVYAPRASGVSLIGDFNQWDDTAHPMERLEDGTWEVACPAAKEGDRYKYRIFRKEGPLSFVDHSDPYGERCQCPPETCSLVYVREQFPWEDEAWIARREERKKGPWNIYEMHFGTWRKYQEDGSDSCRGEKTYQYQELGEHLIPWLKQEGYNAIELLPLCEYPFDGSWGYQITGYYAATARYGTPDGLREFVNACHREEIAVLLDFVPVHFAVDGYGLKEFDGYPLYEYEAKEIGESQWGSCNFDFHRPYVREFLQGAAAFWVERFHMDGLRMDAVRNAVYWQGEENRGVNTVAVQALREMNHFLHVHFPGVLLMAEDSSDYRGMTKSYEEEGVDFDYKWDMGFMHDTLNYLATPPWERGNSHQMLTFSMYYFYNEKYLLAFSHDEVVHGKKSLIDKLWGTYQEKFAQMRTLYLYQMTHPGKKLNFMGNEFGQFREWSDGEAEDWLLLLYPMHRALASYVAWVNELYLQEPALWEEEYAPEAFSWIDVDNREQSVYSYIRRSKAGEEIVVVLNFSAHGYPGYVLSYAGELLPLLPPGESLETEDPEMIPFLEPGRELSCTREEGEQWKMELLPYGGRVFRGIPKGKKE